MRRDSSGRRAFVSLVKNLGVLCVEKINFRKTSNPFSSPQRNTKDYTKGTKEISVNLRDLNLRDQREIGFAGTEAQKIALVKLSDIQSPHYLSSKE